MDEDMTAMAAAEGGGKGRAGSGLGSLLGVESDEVGILSQAAAFAIHSDQQKIRRLR